ncbi:MAG: right-handed parallel beta-helix repeat-containing protein [Kofleriaceae bacterium]
MRDSRLLFSVLAITLGASSGCATDELGDSELESADQPDVSEVSSFATIPGCDAAKPTPPLQRDPNGQIHYVQAGGKYCGSTAAGPFVSVLEAVKCAKPGDTIYIKGGTYPELRISNYRPDLSQSGVPRHLFISAAPGEKVIIDPKAPLADWTSIASVWNSSYVTIANLEITNSAVAQEVSVRKGSVGLAIGGPDSSGNKYSHHITLVSNKIHDVARHAVTLNGGNSFHLETNQLYNLAQLNKFRDMPVHDGGVATARNYNTSCVKITWNSIHDVFGECVGAERLSGGLIEGNRVYNCYSVNIYLDGSENVAVRRNYAYADDPTGKYNRWNRPAVGISIAKELNGGFTARNHEISNNVIERLATGIYYGNYDSSTSANYYSNIVIAHNVIKDMTLRTIVFEAPWANAPGVNKIENNVLFKPWDPNGPTVYLEANPPSGWSGGPFTPPAWQISHNIFPNGIPPQNGSIMRGNDGTNRSGNPGFVGGSGFDLSKFKLAAGSQAIGTGRPTIVPSDYWFKPRSTTNPSIGIHER